MRSGTIDGKWKILETEDRVNLLAEESFNNPVVIFKFSSRCGVSASVFDEFQEKLNAAQPTNAAFYLVDVVANRQVSHAISAVFGIQHESPQALVIKDGECTYQKSHWSISFEEAFLHIAS